MYSWDTYVAMLRNWSVSRWHQELGSRLEDTSGTRIETTAGWLLVSWRRESLWLEQPDLEVSDRVLPRQALH
jgi:hypothetical protein